MLYKGCQKSGQKVPFHVQGVFTPPVCYIRVAKNLDKKFHFMYREFLHPQYAIWGLPKIWTKKVPFCVHSIFSPPVWSIRVAKNLDKKVPFNVQSVFTPPVWYNRVAKNLDNNKDPFHVTSSLLCLACQKSGQKSSNWRTQTIYTPRLPYPELRNSFFFKALRAHTNVARFARNVCVCSCLG